METFWFFWLRFRRAYDSAYDSDFLLSLGYKRSYDSAYDPDSVPSENQPLGNKTLLQQVEKVMISDWWISIRFVFLCFKVRCRWS